MEQSRKNLKISSIFILILGVVSFIDVIIELFFGDINKATLPEGTTENILLIAKIILLVISFVILLPQFYVGFKGLQIAKKPKSSTRHIKWAVVLLVLTIVGVVNALVGILKGTDAKDYISSLFDGALEGIFYYEYIKYARLVAKEQ